MTTVSRRTLRNLVVGTALVVGVLAGTGPASAATAKPFLIGHRGGATGKAVEGTMKAYAIGAKSAAWLEADIRFTKDDLPVLLHDPDIDRTLNGSGPVSSYTLAELHRFRTADGQAIATFAQFTSFLKKTKKKAFIEIKAPPRNDKQWAQLEKWAAPVKRSLIVYSWSPDQLVNARAHGFQTALYERVQGASFAEIRKHGTFYLRQYSAVTRYEITKLKRLGVRTVLFSPSSPTGWKKSQELGAWGVFTGKGAAYAAWRD
jgi:glycerophosphoryl diester phosphodiesterase